MGAIPSFLRRVQQPQRALPASFDGKRVLAWNAPAEPFGEQPVVKAAGTGVIKPVDGIQQLPGDGTTYFSLASALVLSPPYTLFIVGKVPSGSDAYFCGNAATTADFIWGTAVSGFRVRGANSTAVFGNPTTGKTSLFIICCDNKGSAAYRAYQDGVSLGADSNVIGAQSFTLASIGRGRSDATAIPTNSSIGLVAALPGYSLPVEAVREFGFTAWRLFGPIQRRIWVAGGTGGTLNGTASGSDQADGAAAIAAQVALASVGVSVAGGAASPVVSIPMSATGLDVSSANASGQVTVSVSAAALALAAGQAGLSASVLLAAAAAAQASGNAALAAQLTAQAAGADQAGGSATLSGGAPGVLSASGGDVSSGSAVLSVAINLQATGADQAGGSANGQASAPGALVAAGGDQASGWATISTLVTLTAAGFVQAMGAGAFTVTVPLSAAGQSTASGAASPALGGTVRNFHLAALPAVRVSRVVPGVRRLTTIQHEVGHV